MGYNSMAVTIFVPALARPAGEEAIAPDRSVVLQRPIVFRGERRVVVTPRSAWTKIRGMLTLVFVAAVFAGCGPLGDDEEPTAPAATSVPNATAVSSPRVVSTPPIVASPTAAAIASPQITASSPEASPAARLATPRSGTPPPAGVVSRSTPRVSTPTIVPADDATPAGAVAPPVVEDCDPPTDLPEVVGEVQREATETVNVRAGPGLDCDLVTQIEAGTGVTVESGPVEADDRLWVLVTVDEDQGWVAEEFVPGEEVTRGAEDSLPRS